MLIGAKRREEEAEARRQEELLAAVEEEEESQEFATQDYATLNKRDRPLAEDTAGSLPWDDGDVGDWEKVQIAEKESSEAKKKQLMMKATFDAPSGKQFFWPIILAEKKD